MNIVLMPFTINAFGFFYAFRGEIKSYSISLMVNCESDGGGGGNSDLLSDVLRRRRLQWLGHAVRMPSERLPKQVLFG